MQSLVLNCSRGRSRAKRGQSGQNTWTTTASAQNTQGGERLDARRGCAPNRHYARHPQPAGARSEATSRPHRSEDSPCLRCWYRRTLGYGGIPSPFSGVAPGEKPSATIAPTFVDEREDSEAPTLLISVSLDDIFERFERGELTAKEAEAEALARMNEEVRNLYEGANHD